MSGPLVQALEKRRQEDLAKTQPLTPGTLEWAWAQAQKPFKGYWDRQGLMAREGLAMADQGAQQVQQGDLSGLAGMVLGPANYLSSPINALFPIEEAQTQLPKEVSPFVAGGLELMALAAPGPKTKGLGRGVGALVDDVTDAERAALQSRLQTEATQTGGIPSSVTRDQALANLTQAPKGARKPFATIHRQEVLPDGSTRWLPGTLRANPPKKVFEPEMSPAEVKRMGKIEAPPKKGIVTASYKEIDDDGTSRWVPGLLRGKRVPR